MNNFEVVRAFFSAPVKNSANKNIQYVHPDHSLTKDWSMQLLESGWLLLTEPRGTQYLVPPQNVANLEVKELPEPAKSKPRKGSK